MSQPRDLLQAAKEAFCRTISLKMDQFYRVVPKGSNSDLTGEFVEELVRGFIQDWISPFVLRRGTLYPHTLNDATAAQPSGPKQIDGIVFDSQLGPAIIKEGNFLVIDPAFCRGIIEIRTSEKSIKSFEDRLRLLADQYLIPAGSMSSSSAMGVVIQDPNPHQHSYPEWLQPEPVFNYQLGGYCPIFILFEEKAGEYRPYEPAIDAMIRAIFRGTMHWPKHTSL